MSVVDSSWLGSQTEPIDDILCAARARRGCEPCVNVAGIERILSGMIGTCLITTGLSRRSAPGAGVALAGAGLLHRGVTGRCAVYEALGINTAATAASQYDKVAGVGAKRGHKHESSIVICRSTETLFDWWRGLHNLPKLFDHLISVVETDEGRSHWVARGPLGETVEWDAEIHNQKPSKLIAWQSIPGSDMATAGSVHFRATPDENRTVVSSSMKYDPPAGKIGSAVASWMGHSISEELDEGLRRFRQIAEAGEVPSVRGQPQGVCK